MRNLIIIKKIALALSFVTLITSCSDDFLDRKPFADISQDDFYTSEKNLDIAAVGLYGTLQVFYSPGYPQLAELPSDNATEGNGISGAGGQLDKFNIIPNNATLESAWQDSYTSILQCNKILETLPNIDFVDGDKKKQIEGEARFVRALSYFNLVRMFGRVPIDTLVLSQAQARQSIRNEVSEVYELVISDLNTASAQLPGLYTGNSIGRATKWAALSLLGKVYITNHQFTEALIPLHLVVSEGPYSLLPNFADIFKPNNANNAESIFEIQYEGGTLGEGSRWSFVSHPRDVQEIFNISAGAQLVPTSDIYNLFSDQGEIGAIPSPRYEATIGTVFYQNAAGSTLSARHIKKHYMDFTLQNQSDDNWPLIRLADVMLMYAEALNETSATPSPTAIELVNKIRRRAFGYPISTVSDKDLIPTINTVDFREVVYLERRLELAFEGHRWFDLVRTNTYQTVMNQHFGANSSYKVEAYHNIFPIPQREIDINPLLKPNNDGYN